MSSYDERFQRMQDTMYGTSSLIAEMSPIDVEYDMQELTELQFQMMEYAYTHENFMIHMDRCFEILVTYYWTDRKEKVEGSFDDYRKLGNRKNSIYCSIERYCMCLVIDEKPVNEKRVISIIRGGHSLHKTPF